LRQRIGVTVGHEDGLLSVGSEGEVGCNPAEVEQLAPETDSSFSSSLAKSPEMPSWYFASYQAFHSDMMMAG
jgi:hypothetical protein